MKDYSVLSDLPCQWAQLVTAYDKGYEQGYVEGQKHDLEHTENIVRSHEKCKSVLEAEYERGLETAWSCAKRIMSMPLSDQEKIFNMQDERAIMDAHSAEEAIDILKRYDEKNDEIKVGDKVRIVKDSDGFNKLFPIGTVGIVEIVGKDNKLKYKISANGDYWWYRRDMIELVKDDEIKVGDEIVYSNSLKGEEKGIVMGVCNNWVEVKFLRSWNCIGVHKDSVKKTGRHFEQLDEILETMKNE